MINQLAREIHENNKRKGFYDTQKNIGEMLALIHSEVSEALEADRNGRYEEKILAEVDGHHQYISPAKFVMSIKDDVEFQLQHEIKVKDTVEAELVDVLIRTFDMLHYLEADIEDFLAAIMRYNSLRKHKHGRKY